MYVYEKRATYFIGLYSSFINPAHYNTRAASDSLLLSLKRARTDAAAEIKADHFENPNFIGLNNFFPLFESVNCNYVLRAVGTNFIDTYLHLFFFFLMQEFIIFIYYIYNEVGGSKSCTQMCGYVVTRLLG